MIIPQSSNCSPPDWWLTTGLEFLPSNIIFETRNGKKMGVISRINVEENVFNQGVCDDVRDSRQYLRYIHGAHPTQPHPFFFLWPPTQKWSKCCCFPFSRQSGLSWSEVNPKTSAHTVQAELITAFLLLLWPAAYHSSDVVSQSACCVFHFNIVSGDSRQLSLVTSPPRKTLHLTLLTCPYGDFFFKRY